MDQNDRSTFLGITYFRTCCIPPTNQRPEWLHSRCDSTFGIKWEPSYYLDGEICQTFRDVKLAPKVWLKLGICTAGRHEGSMLNVSKTWQCIALHCDLESLQTGSQLCGTIVVHIWLIKSHYNGLRHTGWIVWSFEGTKIVLFRNQRPYGDTNLHRLMRPKAMWKNLQSLQVELSGGHTCKLHQEKVT